MENNYQLTRIHNYVMGLMSQKEMYELENEALNDPFLQDALEGYKLQNGVDTKKISILQQRLARRIVSRNDEKNLRFFTWQRLAIGLTAAVLFMVVCSLIFFNHFGKSNFQKTNDVILMEENMRIETRSLDNSDAIPTQGWKEFNEELNSELRDLSGTGKIKVEFIVVQGLAKQLTIQHSTNKSIDNSIKSFVLQKVQWTGKKGVIEIEVD